MPEQDKNSAQEKFLDDSWYEKFKEIGAFQDFEFLTGEKNYREQQKDSFFSGEIENPSLDYPELNKVNFDQKEKDLLDLKSEILKNESNEVVKQLYRWKLNEKIAELRMLKATKENDDKRFSRYSQFIYGTPEKQIYEYTLSQAKKVIDKKLSDPDPFICEAAKRLNKKLFEALMENENKINPSDYNLPQIKLSQESIDYSAEEIKQAFEKTLNNLQVLGWEVIIDKEGRYTGINVSQEKKKINIPESARLKQSQLEAMIEHEIGTHVLRRERGERSKLKLLGLGLDRFLKGEEGIATYKEQGVRGTKEFTGFDGHFAISLATGLDGKKRNFREVFEILRDYYFINSRKNKNEALKYAKESAWIRCLRTFRGTSCKTPGTCLTRDIVYREGNIGVWNVVKNNPEEIRRFSVGKYDPANPRHIWILEQLGITDDDLQKLEE